MTAQTEAPEAKTAELGKARLRKEDERLITGQTNWTDNITLPGMLHIAFLRSPFAHARITSVDVSAARNEPGVIAAYSGADFAAEQGSLPCAWPVTPDIVIPAHPPMAVDEVRYVGEAVACVVARDRYAAADALAAIEVDYEQLPPVLDMRTALDDASPKVHEAGNKSFVWPFVQGDIEAAFRDAPIVIERTFRQQRLIPAAMEPRAVVCSSVGGEFTLWSATQIPHILRVMLALVTGIPEQNIRVIAPDVGGGFGSKLQVTAEEVLAVLIARKLGRPVKWTESRSEGNMTVHHGRDQWQRIRIAADSDGRLRGLDVDLLADMGAYLMLVTPGIPILGAFMYPAIYKMDAYSFKCTGVFTTKMPTDAYRGAGRPEATFAIERIMDELAAHLGVDPLVVRERNWIKHEEFPYTTIATLTYDSGNYEAATAKAKDLFGYDELRKEQEQRRASNDPVQLGIGISTFTEMCGLAPSRVLGSLAYAAGGWEQASIRMLPTGKVEVVTGSSAHGQGHETAWSQIVADQLGVPFEDIRVLHGDTQISPKGMDTYGSRSLAVGGMALVSACDKVIDKAKVIAAGMLEASADDLEWSPGRFAVRGDPDKGVTIGEIAFTAFAAHNLPDGVEPSIDAEATYDPDNFSFPHGTHLCATEVDTETGFVKIRSYVCVDDIGAVVNPMIVDGQVHGGVAQGIAQALYEEAVYDDDGNLVTSTLADYLVPSAADLPSYVTGRTESRAANALGVKGVGEAGTIASTPAVVNAIVDALRPLGINDVEMPCTPERVWRAIQGARGGEQASGAEQHAARQSDQTQGHSPQGIGTPDQTGGVGMIPAKFDYVRPGSLDEAVSALAGGGDDAKVIAGGQSLLPLLRLRLAYPELLVDVGGLDELRGVTDAGDALVIGARTTHHQLIRDPLVAEHCGLLAQAAATVADPAVRHRGTLGGSLAHADPAGDLPAVALALDATMVARGPGGEREIAAADFFVDYLTSSLQPDEILTAIRVPKLGPGWGYRYEKFHRTAQAWATVGVAALVRRSNGSVAEARIGLTNMGPTPLRATAAESAAAGAQASRDALRAAAGSADEGTNPPGDLHGAPDYRRHLARVLTGRALAAAAGA